MDKFDFINRIIALYPHLIKDSSAQYDVYDRVLSKNKIDYEKLMDIFANEYKESFPPTGAALKEMANRCLKDDVVQEGKWLPFKVFNPIYKCVTNNDCFPAGTSEEKMLNYYKKRFGGEGWRIVEVTNGGI